MRHIYNTKDDKIYIAATVDDKKGDPMLNIYCTESCQDN